MLGAYKIVHIKSGKVYVGSSFNIENRLKRHLRSLKNGTHHNSNLQKLFDKCGKKGFEIKKRQCETREEAYKVELYVLQNLPKSKLLNIGLDVIGGDNITNNPKYDSIVAKMSKSVRASMAKLSPEERKEKFGLPGSSNGMYGKTHTQEVRDKLSKVHKGNQYCKGKKKSKEERENLSRYLRENGLRVGALNGFYGKKHTPEVLKTLSQKNKGKVPVNARPVKIDGVKYQSAKFAAKKLGIPYVTVWHRCNNDNPKFKNYRFI